MFDRFRAWARPSRKPVVKTEVSEQMTFSQFFARYDSPEWGGSKAYVPTAREMESAYTNHPIVRACIDIIAGTTPVPLLEVGAYTDATWDALKGHPALDLLHKPNPYQGLYELLVEFTTKAYAGGVGYLWKIRNQGGSKIVELRAVPASWVTPIRPLQGLDMVQYYQVQGQPAVVMPEDMIEMRFPAVSDMCSSLGPLAGAWTEIKTDRERSQTFSEIIANMDIPGTAIRSKIGSKPPQMQADMLRSVENRIGRGKRGSTFLLGQDDEIIAYGAIPDLDWPGLMAACESRICAALGVPPLLVQSRIGLEKATYSNAEQMNQNFYQNTMARYWKQLAGVLTRGLLQDGRVGRGDERLEFRFDYEQLPEFREDANAEAARLVSLATTGVVTMGEVRAELGFPPIADVLGQQDADEEAIEAAGGQMGDGEEQTPESEPAAPVAAPTAPPVASLLQIAQAVADGTLSREAALSIMRIAFPSSDAAELERIAASIAVREPEPTAPVQEETTGA